MIFWNVSKFLKHTKNFKNCPITSRIPQVFLKYENFRNTPRISKIHGQYLKLTGSSKNVRCALRVPISEVENFKNKLKIFKCTKNFKIYRKFLKCITFLKYTENLRIRAVNIASWCQVFVLMKLLHSRCRKQKETTWRSSKNISNGVGWFRLHRRWFV